tara:strand:+ start:117 stop:434 length:318 start_codon:yes stop_codon:yes gene_type:complete
MFQLLLIIDKDLNEKEEKNIERHTQLETLITLLWAKKEEDRSYMGYKEICSLCKGNGYITVVVEEKDEIKQCWLCESQGEKKYSQAEVDDFIYNMYYKKGKTNAV